MSPSPPTLVTLKATLQLCIENGKYSLELGEIDMGKPQSDGILFQRIRKRYEEVRHSFLPMRLRFSKPDKVVFVKVSSRSSIGILFSFLKFI
jgi:hypothetical protein